MDTDFPPLQSAVAVHSPSAPKASAGGGKRFTHKSLPRGDSSPSTIESLFQVEEVELLHEAFVSEGGHGKALPLRRFIEAVSAILLPSSPAATVTPPGSAGTQMTNASTSGPRRSVGVLTGSSKVRQDIKRWAMSMATTTRGAGRSGDSDEDLRALQAATEDALHASSSDPLQGGKDKFCVLWSDVTTALIRAEQLKEGLKDQLLDFRRLPMTSRTPPSALHTFCPSLAVTSDSTGKLVTAGRDGLVKMWNPVTGAFEKNLYNSGFSWILDVSFSESENLVYVCSSNAQLAVLEFPSGNVVQQYVGCPREDAAVSTVVNRSTVHTQRFGMLPGECGPRKIHFPNILAISQEEFTERRRLAREGPTFKTVDVKPIVGFVDPTAFCSVVDLHLCAFGTHHGGLGVFDISEDIRQSSLITGSSIKAIHQLMHTPCHDNSVSALRYSSRSRSLLSSGLDGCIYKTPLDTQLLGDRPIRHNTSETPGELMKPILGMDWSERQQVLATFSSDKRIKLWSPMRAEALHVIEALPHDVLSLVLIKDTEQFAALTADKMIRVFDLRTFRCIQVIPQSVANEDSTGASLDNNFVTVLKASVDIGGALAYDTRYAQLVCALRTPVYYSALASAADGSTQPSTAITTTLLPQEQPSSGEGGPIDMLTAASFDLFSGARGAGAALTSAAPTPAVSVAAHGLPVLDTLYSKNGKLLVSLDTDNILSWNIASGECINSAEVARQVAKLEFTGNKSFKLTTASWATSEHARVVTGTQTGALIIWNGTANDALSILQLSSPVKLSDVAAVKFRGPFMLASVVNRTHVIEWNVDKVLSNGVYLVNRLLSIDIPSDSISAAAIIRDSTMALGTVDAKLYLANFDSMTVREVVLEATAAVAASGLPMLGGGGVTASAADNTTLCPIEEIIFLNRKNQCSLLVLFEDGVVLLVSALERTVVKRQRVFCEGEAKLTAAALSATEEFLAVGDSTGRLRVFLVISGRAAAVQSANSSGTTQEWTCKLRLVASVQVTYEAVSSIRMCDDVNCVVAGTEDGFLKLFLLEGLVACQAREVNTIDVTHVGNFGESLLWDLSDPQTFQRVVLPKAQHNTSPPRISAEYDISSGTAISARSDSEFLSTVLRTARRKKYPAPDYGSCSVSSAVGGALGQDVQQRHQLAGGSAHILPRQPLSGFSPMSTARSLATGRPSTVPAPPGLTAGASRQLAFDGTLGSLVGAGPRPATQPGRSRSQSPRIENTSSPRDHHNTAPTSSSPAQPLALFAQVPYPASCSSAFTGASPNVPIPAPPAYSSQTAILDRLRGPKLSVKRRVIDAPDVDLGNGIAVKSVSLHPFDSSTAKQEDGRSSPVVPRLNLQGDTFLTSLPQLDFGQSSVAERDNLNSTQQLQQQHTSPEGSVRSQAVVDRGEADETEETLVWADSLYDEVAPVGLIDVPSASAEPSNSAVVDATTGTSPSALFPSGAEVDAAHQSTKKLLTRMAQRLDLVCPSGYGEMSFSKKLVKLYRTPQGETTANTAQQQESNAMIVLGASGDGQEQTLGETLSPAPPPQMEEEEGPEDWDEYAERFLAALRTPETAKNVAEMHDRIRQYKRSREVGGGGRQVANWITRVSSQLKVENLQISAPSLIAKTTTTKFSFPATARAPRQGPSSPRETHDRVLLTARK